MIEIDVQQTKEFAEWLRKLRDAEARLRIVQRVQRFKRGNAGDTRPVGGPVREMRIDYGPGYRVYFTRRGNTVVLLLCGGDKRTQQADIARARELAEQWRD